MRIQYHGWSGITVHYESAVVGFDLMSAAPLQGEGSPEEVLCVTHGHPDHCGALLEAEDDGVRFDGAALVSSSSVVDHFTGEGLFDEGFRFQSRDSRTVRDIRVTAFQWVHQPLLPPEFEGKVDYLQRLFGSPTDLARIATTGLRLPATSPTLGFHLAPPEGPTVLNYAEGLHRMTEPNEVTNMAQRFPDLDVLLAAVEPDDTAAVPRWVERLQPSRVFLFEAHRPWRETFDLETVDLDDYAAGVDARLSGIRVEALGESGEAWRV